MARSDQIKKEIKKSKGSKKKLIIIVAVLAVIASASYLYFFIISPTFVAKPFLEKPTLAENEEIGEDHINWVVNELGGYKLHPSPLGGDPVIELVIEGNTFTVTTSGNNVLSSLGTPSDPDIRITANREAFERILSADDAQEEIIDLFMEGAVGFEMIKDEATLALKGYKGIYDELSR